MPRRQRRLNGHSLGRDPPKLRIAAKTPKRLPAGLRGLLARYQQTNGADVNPNAPTGSGRVTDTPRPITLPVVRWLQRPEIPMSDRERLGKDYKLPAISKADATTIEDGVRAWSRLKANSVMQDWLAVGRALLIGRKLCMAQVNAKKPRGVKYVTANSAWVKKHGFDEISRCGRQTSMLVVEHLPEIEAWLLTLSDDKRTGLNHPQVIWSQFRAYRQGCDETKSRQGWRDKQLSEERFGKLFEAIDDTLETGDPLVIAIAAARALGYSVPKEILQDQKHYRQSRVTIRPALAYAPWTPFEMRL